MKPELRTGPWRLTDLADVEKNGLKVFSCFHCGGGSTMGYKLAGFDVMGGVEIDPEMMAIYRANQKPRHSFLMGVQDFNKLPIESIPDEVRNLDVLDGSPPCSSFSMSGSREKAWGKQKKFREGQADQVLDDLFFHFIETANRLRPKIVIAENVKGLVLGNARGYVKEIFQAFGKAGYDAQLFLLNASRMGVPQRRERTFFIGRRRDLTMTPITLEFNEQPISAADAVKNVVLRGPRPLTETAAKYWYLCKPGSSFASIHPTQSLFNWIKLAPNIPANTITSSGAPMIFHWSEPRVMDNAELVRLQTFPDDYNSLETDLGYVVGMSVPPFMMQRVANRIANHFFSKNTA